MDENKTKGSKKIYLLGTGGVGKLVAHALRGIPDPPPVTILFHRKAYYDDFKEADNSISLTTGSNTETRGGFGAELAPPKSAGYPPDAEPIHNLIVSVKAHQTVAALGSVSSRLRKDSTVLFLQNGMGVIDEVNEKLYPNPEERPRYIQGINSHGITSTGTCTAIHAGQGTFMLGILPRETDPSHQNPNDATDANAGPRYLLRTITRTPVFAAVGVSPEDLVQAQLEKLVVNCLINPLTVVFDCRNGNLLHNFAISRTVNLLLAEISLVIRSLPELKGIPNIAVRFSPERLEATFVNVAQKTGENISSMLQDMRRGAKTEIEYINGYIVRRGEELGIKAVMNYMLMQMVTGKQQLVSKEMDNFTPVSKQTL